MQGTHRPPHVVGVASINWNHVWLGLSVLSLLSFAGLGQARYRGLMWSIRAVGWGCAVSAVYGYRQDRKRGRVYGHHQELLAAVEEVGAVYEEQVAQLHRAYQQQLSQLHHDYGAQLSQWEQAYEAARVENHQLHQQRTSEAEVQQQQLGEERSQLQQQTTAMWQHIETAQDELEAAQGQLAADRAALAEREQQFEQDVQQRLQEAQTQLDEREAAMSQRFEAEWASREAFFTTIANDAISQYEASKVPDYPKGVTHEELLSRAAIDCLKEWSIIAKRPIVTPLPKKKFSLSFDVFPVLEDGTIKTAIRSATEALKLIKQDVLPALKMAVPSCSALPSVQPVSDIRLELTFDISGVDWKAINEQKRQQEQQGIIEPSPAHLIQFVQHNPHINFMADSGSGKTTLINNLIAIAQAELGPQTTLVGVNPKPNADSDLSILKYIGFEESIYGLLEAVVEVYHRVETNNKVFKFNRSVGDRAQYRPLPEWSPMIFLIDEYSELMSRWNNIKPAELEEVLQSAYQQTSPDKRYVIELIAKRVAPTSFAGDLTKVCWRVGRSEQVKLFLAGQNLKASVFKVTIQDIQQQAYIYAGQAINEGIKNRIQPWHRERISDHYELREEAVIDGDITKFYGLFVPKDGVPYFAAFPQQGEYLETASTRPGPEERDASTSHSVLDSHPGADQEDAPSPHPSEETRTHPAPEDLNHLNACWEAEWADHEPPRTSDERTGADPTAHRCTPPKSPTPRTGAEDETPTSAAHDQAPHPPFDPLLAEVNEALIEAVMMAYLQLNSQTKVIETVWGVKKSGTSKAYRAAKHHFRVILNTLEIVLPGKPWGDDPDDHTPFAEIIA